MKRSVSHEEKQRRRASLTAADVRALLCYDPDTGEFSALKARGPMKAGAKPGTVDDEGRLVITINYVRHFAHRLAWLYMTGSWPRHEIDHRDGDRLNNRWENLRDVTSTVNQQNKRRSPVGKRFSPLLGAHWDKTQRIWKSSIRHNGKVVHLGVFDTDVAASAAYIEAKRRLHEGCTI